MRDTNDYAWYRCYWNTLVNTGIFPYHGLEHLVLHLPRTCCYPMAGMADIVGLTEALRGYAADCWYSLVFSLIMVSSILSCTCHERFITQWQAWRTLWA